MIRKIKKEVGCSFKENIQYMDQTLPVEKSFDIIRREMEIGGKESVFYYIDGFIKDEAMLKIMDSFLSITAEDLPQDAEAIRIRMARRFSLQMCWWNCRSLRRVRQRLRRMVIKMRLRQQDQMWHRMIAMDL